MTAVAIPEKYVAVLSALGNVQTAIDLALQRYTIEQIAAKITQLRQRAQGYQATYGMGFTTFTQLISASMRKYRYYALRGNESVYMIVPEDVGGYKGERAIRACATTGGIVRVL